MHTIATSRWLRSHGISYDNMGRYKQSEWVHRVGSGAFQRVFDQVSWEGAVYGLQKQYPNLYYIVDSEEYD